MLLSTSRELSRKLKIFLLMLIDINIVLVAYILSFFITYIYYNNEIKLFDVIKFTPVIVLMYISTLWVFKMYKSRE